MSKKGIALFLAFLMLFSIFTPQMTTYAATTENIEEVTTSEDTNENDLEQSTEEPENTGQNTEITSTESVEESTEQSTEQSTEVEPDAQAAPTGAPVTLSDDGMSDVVLETFTRAAGSVQYYGGVKYKNTTVAHFTIGGETAFCMQHGIPAPSTGMQYNDSIYEDENIRRVLYYGWNGQAQWSGFDGNENKGIVITSLALSHYYHNTPANVNTSYYIEMGLKDFIDYCNANSIPDSRISFSTDSVKAYRSGDMQRTDSQKRDAQYVQSFPAWKKMGYSVKRGETGLKIWVPVKVTLLNINGNNVPLSDATKEQKEAYRKGDIEGKVISRFKIGTVFDIGQTTFPPEDYPKLFSVGYPSELHEDLCKGVADFAKDVIHCDVKYEDLSSATLRGFYSRDLNQIVINSSLKGTQKLSTLCHELGHALRHNTVSKLSTHGKELEADAVSVMIESGLGLELTDARKDHLADHYRDFKAEIKQELGKDFTDEAMIQKIDDMLSSVYSTYNDIVEDLNKSIEKYVPQERLLEYQKNNEVSHEQLPKKDIDVAPEMDMDYDLEM